MSNKSINKVILIGYLGQNPDIKYTNNGNPITTINIATSENWKDKISGDIKERIDWHRIVFFGKIAEIASEYLKKGSHVYIEGQLKNRKWKDQNGNDKYITEVIVNLNGVMKILNNIKSFNDLNNDFEKNSTELEDNNIKNDDIDFNLKNDFDNEEDISF